MARNGKGDKQRKSQVSSKKYRKSHDKTYKDSKKKNMPKGNRAIVVGDKVYWWKVKYRGDDTALSVYCPTTGKQKEVAADSVPYIANVAGVTPEKVKRFIQGAFKDEE